MADIVCELGQFFTLSCRQTDGNGNFVPFVDTPEWSSSDETVIKVQVSENNLEALAQPQGAGTANISVTADSLTGTWSVQVTGGKIVFQCVAPFS